MHSFNNLNSPMNRRGSKPLQSKWRTSKSPQINTVTENIVEERNRIDLMIKGLMNLQSLPPENSGKPNSFRNKLKDIQHKIRNSRLNREEKKEIIDLNVCFNIFLYYGYNFNDFLYRILF